MISIRQEGPGDREAVRFVNQLAFAGQEEAEIVDALHETPGLDFVSYACQNILSFVFSPFSK